MKILLVAIPNHHFFQWANQLKYSGYEVYWFDVTDGAGFVDKINWVKQFNSWKLKYNYPFRNRIKNSFPKIYYWIQKINTRNLLAVFEQKLVEIQPDIVHCFEMNLTGLPILEVMNKYREIPFIYSSWGSDMYYFKEHRIQKKQVQLFLQRVDCLITDCHRDYTIAFKNGFNKKFIGVYPGNGGILYPKEFIQETNKRKIILLKGYESFGCKASKILEALELLPVSFFQDLEIIIYSADKIIIDKIQNSPFFINLKFKIYPRTIFIANEDVLKIMGETCIHISNNISDGMPNTLLESMGMGAFPIQSNPGNATGEIIQHGVNGYLIDDPYDSAIIATFIKDAMNNQALRKEAQDYNIKFAHENYDRFHLKNEIVKIYHDVLTQKK